MTEKFKCECGSEDFEITADTHDQVVFLCNVAAEDGEVTTLNSLKDYVGDTDYHDEVKCWKCGKVYDLSGGVPVLHKPDGQELKDYTVILKYPDYVVETGTDIETFTSWSTGKDINDAICNAQLEASKHNDGDIAREDFGFIIAFDGHLHPAFDCAGSV